MHASLHELLAGRMVPQEVTPARFDVPHGEDGVPSRPAGAPNVGIYEAEALAKRPVGIIELMDRGGRMQQHEVHVAPLRGRSTPVTIEALSGADSVVASEVDAVRLGAHLDAADLGGTPTYRAVYRTRDGGLWVTSPLVAGRPRGKAIPPEKILQRGGIAAADDGKYGAALRWGVDSAERIRPGAIGGRIFLPTDPSLVGIASAGRFWKLESVDAGIRLLARL